MTRDAVLNFGARPHEDCIDGRKVVFAIAVAVDDEARVADGACGRVRGGEGV